jgi:hypothetical protein
MEELSRDVLYSIAMELDDLEILTFCQTNKTIFNKVCGNIYFIRTKLKRDYDFNLQGNDSKLGNIYYTFLCKNKTKTVNKQMKLAARGGHKDLVDFFIGKGATDWEVGMYGAAMGGHKDLVDFFIEKGASAWNWSMEVAAEGGHKDLVEFFIGKGASAWIWGMRWAAKGCYKDLVDFFIEKGATNWNWGMEAAAEGGHTDLVEFFRSKTKDEKLIII